MAKKLYKLSFTVTVFKYVDADLINLTPGAVVDYAYRFLNNLAGDADISNIAVTEIPVKDTI